MSVTAINVVAQPSLDDSAEGVTIPVRLEAKCSSVQDGVLAVRAHANCPRRGDTYSFYGESDASLVCTNVNIAVKPDSFGLDRSKVYTIVATYSNTVPSGGLGEDEEDPLDDPPTYEFSFIRIRPATHSVRKRCYITWRSWRSRLHRVDVQRTALIQRRKRRHVLRLGIRAAACNRVRH